MTKSKTRMYEANAKGKKVRVTVPENPDPVEMLKDALRENLSPQAVATIAAELHGLVKTKDAKVNGEVAWFTQQLLDMLGDEYNALCEEVGL